MERPGGGGFCRKTPATWGILRIAMTRSILILCDERDLEVGNALRESLRARGADVTVEACDAAAETLGTHARERLAAAAKVIVVVREGGRGNRLLHAAEDEARAGTEVVCLLADPSPDGAVSARTSARIHVVTTTLLGASPPAPTAKKAAPWLAALFGAVLLAILVALWLLRSPAAPLDGPPVLLTGMLSNSGWMVTFHLPEEPSFLEYKLPGDRDFVSTGDLGPTSGPKMTAPHARTTVMIPELHGRVPVQVRYRTESGAERGPYETVFDTSAEAVASVKRVLRDVPGWVSFRLFSGRRLCYFSTLLTYKYALRSIRYGVDNDDVDHTVRFTPRDVPGIDTNDDILIDLPERAATILVELTFLDGTTEKKRFPIQY